jgi:hypothetical protein
MIGPLLDDDHILLGLADAELAVFARQYCLEQGLDPAGAAASLAAWATAVRFSLYAFLAGAFFLSRTYSITLYMIIGLAIALGEIGRRTGQITVNWRSILTRAAVGTFASVVGIYFFLKVAKLVS